jgi:hypothetical protein
LIWTQWITFFLSQSLSRKCQVTEKCKELVDISSVHVGYTEIPLVKCTSFIIGGCHKNFYSDFKSSSHFLRVYSLKHCWPVEIWQRVSLIEFKKIKCFKDVFRTYYNRSGQMRKRVKSNNRKENNQIVLEINDPWRKM